MNLKYYIPAPTYLSEYLGLKICREKRRQKLKTALKIVITSPQYSYEEVDYVSMVYLYKKG
jgi:hypothetical protein